MGTGLTQTKATSRSGLSTAALHFLLVVLALAILGLPLYFGTYNTASTSMVPALVPVDYFIVTKFSYGYSRFTLPFMPERFHGRVLYSPPARGDVVVFKLPRDSKTDYVKRVVGLPGDRIRVKGGLLYINGEPVKREPVEELQMPHLLGFGQHFHQYVETLPGGRSYRIVELGDNQLFDNTPEFLVPADHFFVLGDNRDNSSDSRDPQGGVGYVPAENLIGRVLLILFSYDRSGPSGFTLQVNRMLHLVQ